jgi:hypothetical protein
MIPTGEHGMAGTGTAHRVAVVVDPEFGYALLRLASHVHVWIIDTLTNRAAAEIVWSKEGGVPSLERGVTTFSKVATDAPDEIVASVLDSIELHHGEYSHSPPWSVLEVYGTTPTPSLSTALAEHWFTNISPTPGGFRAWRPVVLEGSADR